MTQFFFRFSPELLDFIAACVRMDPVARPTAAELLLHPFMQRCKSLGHIDPPNQPSLCVATTWRTPLTDNEIAKITHKLLSWYEGQHGFLPAPCFMFSTMRKIILHLCFFPFYFHTGASITSRAALLQRSRPSHRITQTARDCRVIRQTFGTPRTSLPSPHICTRAPLGW